MGNNESYFRQIALEAAVKVLGQVSAADRKLVVETAEAFFQFLMTPPRDVPGPQASILGRPGIEDPYKAFMGDAGKIG